LTNRIAVASNDGNSIDQHFAQATRFYIYDVLENSYEFIELRTNVKVEGHDENQFDKVLEVLKDCRAIFVAQIGPGAARYINNKGFRTFESPYPVEKVLNRMIEKHILEKP
jgi:nitrogen fixation protein NifX